jgi:hypothetical protein
VPSRSVLSQQAALDLKANLASPTFTGQVTAYDFTASHSLVAGANIVCNGYLSVGAQSYLNGNVYVSRQNTTGPGQPSW